MGNRITPQNLLQGQAGVYQVAAQLCLRGLNPFFPAVDNGTDILVDGLIRVQVKAAHLRYNHKVYPQGAYWFKLGRTAIRQKRQVWESVNFSDFCDFGIFWGIEQNRFWVIPAAALDGHQLITLGPDVTYRAPEHPIQLREYEGKWDLLDECLNSMHEIPTFITSSSERTNV